MTQTTEPASFKLVHSVQGEVTETNVKEVKGDLSVGVEHASELGGKYKDIVEASNLTKLNVNGAVHPMVGNTVVTKDGSNYNEEISFTLRRLSSDAPTLKVV